MKASTSLRKVMNIMTLRMRGNQGVALYAMRIHHAEAKRSREVGLLQKKTLDRAIKMKESEERRMRSLEQEIMEKSSEELSRLHQRSLKMLRHAGVRDLQALIWRLVKGESAMRIDIWRAQMMCETMVKVSTVKAGIEAEMMVRGMKSMAVRQMVMRMALIMRGEKSVTLHAIRINCAADRRRLELQCLQDQVEQSMHHRAMRDMRTVIWRLVKGETAMRIEVWRSRTKDGSLKESSVQGTLAAAVVLMAERKVAMRQIILRLTRIMRGEQAIVIQAIKLGCSVDRIRRREEGISGIRRLKLCLEVIVSGEKACAFQSWRRKANEDQHMAQLIEVSEKSQLQMHNHADLMDKRVSIMYIRTVMGHMLRRQTASHVLCWRLNCLNLRLVNHPEESSQKMIHEMPLEMSPVLLPESVVSSPSSPRQSKLKHTLQRMQEDADNKALKEWEMETELKNVSHQLAVLRSNQSQLDDLEGLSKIKKEVRTLRGELGRVNALNSRLMKQIDKHTEAASPPSTAPLKVKSQTLSITEELEEYKAEIRTLRCMVAQSEAKEATASGDAKLESLKSEFNSVRSELTSVKKEKSKLEKQVASKQMVVSKGTVEEISLLQSELVNVKTELRELRKEKKDLIKFKDDQEKREREKPAKELERRERELDKREKDQEKRVREAAVVKPCPAKKSQNPDDVHSAVLLRAVPERLKALESIFRMLDNGKKGLLTAKDLLKLGTLRRTDGEDGWTPQKNRSLVAKLGGTGYEHVSQIDFLVLYEQNLSRDEKEFKKTMAQFRLVALEIESEHPKPEPHKPSPIVEKRQAQAARDKQGGDELSKLRSEVRTLRAELGRLNLEKSRDGIPSPPSLPRDKLEIDLDKYKSECRTLRAELGRKNAGYARP